jgi:secretion/DNA translocation related TadE-like protein
MLRYRDERGAGSILVVAILAAVIGLAALAIPLYSVLVTKRAAEGAADAAALAAADVAVGRAPGVICDVAARVAEANAAVLTDCHPDGLVVTVRVERQAAGFAIGAIASAGPPETPP